MTPVVLLTGVTGFLGRELLSELLTATSADVICLIRADDDATARTRMQQVVSRLFGDDAWEVAEPRITAVQADLTRPQMGLHRGTFDAIVERTTHVIHGAASVRFDLSLSEARQINVGGTLAMLQLVKACHSRGRLRRFGYVGTSFVAGLCARHFTEDDLDVGQSFRNTYEQSKFEAEMLIHAHAPRLPWTIVRPSIVVGHSRFADNSGLSAAYWPLRLYADRILRYAPTHPDTLVDVVPVDFVARGTIEAVLGGGEPGRVYALAAGRRAQSARVIAQLAADAYGVPPLRLFSTPVDRWVLPKIATLLSVGPWGGHARTLRQYLPYFLHSSQFDTRWADALLGSRGIEPPPPNQFLTPIIELARATDFGRDMSQVEQRRAEIAAQRRAALPVRKEVSLTGRPARRPARARAARRPQAADHPSPV